MSFTESKKKSIIDYIPKGRGGGTPYNGQCGEAPPKRDTFFRLQVYERVGKSAISVCKTYRCILWLWKGQEKVLGLGFVHTFKTVHLQELKGMQSYKIGKWKGYHLSINRRYAKGVPFLSNRYIKGKGLDLGRRLSIQKFVEYLDGRQQTILYNNNLSFPYFSVGGYSALIDFVLGLCCFSSSFSFLSCSLNISDRIPPGVRVLR